MRRFYIKEYVGQDWFWKLIAFVPDNEALGLLERIFSAAGLEVKVENAPR